MAVLGAQELADARRQHLVALAYEVEGRGLSWRLAGPEESVLCVGNPNSRKQVMIVATPFGDGWSYLWAGGGMADAANPGRVADLLMRRLS